VGLSKFLDIDKVLPLEAQLQRFPWAHFVKYARTYHIRLERWPHAIPAPCPGSALKKLPPSRIASLKENLQTDTPAIFVNWTSSKHSSLTIWVVVQPHIGELAVKECDPAYGDIPLIINDRNQPLLFVKDDPKWLKSQLPLPRGQSAMAAGSSQVPGQDFMAARSKSSKSMHSFPAPVDRSVPPVNPRKRPSPPEFDHDTIRERDAPLHEYKHATSSVPSNPSQYPTLAYTQPYPGYDSEVPHDNHSDEADFYYSTFDNPFMYQQPLRTLDPLQSADELWPPHHLHQHHTPSIPYGGNGHGGFYGVHGGMQGVRGGVQGVRGGLRGGHNVHIRGALGVHGTGARGTPGVRGIRGQGNIHGGFHSGASSSQQPYHFTNGFGGQGIAGDFQ